MKMLKDPLIGIRRYYRGLKEYRKIKMLKDPLIGVRRYYRGLKEYRYIYTPDELLKLENECHKKEINQIYGRDLTLGDLDLYESGFCGNDTYWFEVLTADFELEDFLFDAGECTGLSEPTLEDFEEIVSELSKECMYTGAENLTTLNIINEFGLKDEDLILHDCRFDEVNYREEEKK